MSHTALEKEIRALPESYISEISQFIVYLKLKEHFSAFENSNSYENALALWRNDSASLFSNPEDSAFMQNAFAPPRSREIYKNPDCCCCACKRFDSCNAECERL